MSESLAPQGPQPPHLAEEPPVTVAARLALFQRAGGIVTPVITAVIAFLIGGLVVLATGHNPLRAYWSIIQGAGLNWFAHPWVTDTSTHISTYNFVQTLIQTTTLVLTGLAVAFAFRCGLFNIGGQGQYLVGVFVATWVGVNFAHMAGPAHILLGVAAAAAAGAIWAGIAGFLKATVGAHEVITTIMLNWIAYWLGTWLFVQGGPLQGKANRLIDVPESDQIVRSARLPTIWGDPVQLRQLMQNLISNALKFRRDDVQHEVAIDAMADGDTVTLIVRDNGIGFEPRYGRRIFRVFERLHGRDEYRGTGIGLALCRKIAERHGGSILAEGVPGEGAMFMVTLPLSGREEVIAIPHDDEPGGAASETHTEVRANVAA